MSSKLPFLLPSVLGSSGLSDGSVRVTIYPVDGTGSTDPRHTNPNATGGYPARVAQQLVAHDPVLWNWVPIDYPASGYPIGPSVDDGAGKLIAYINATPGPFVLSGLSQGAMVCSKVYNEIRYGSLRHRRADFVAGVMFGSPAREPGHTINLPGATDPGGGGIQRFYLRQSYGSQWGVLSDCEDLWWEFANPGDPACTQPDNAGAREVARGFGFIYKGLTVPGLEAAVELLAAVVLDPLSVGEALKWVWDILTLPTSSPHIRYQYPYTPLTGNTTKSAVDLAVD
jgi:hypothetical protein